MVRPIEASDEAFLDFKYRRSEEWPRLAEIILSERYATTPWQELARTLRPLLGGRVTRNQIYGKAYRMRLKKPIRRILK